MKPRSIPRSLFVTAGVLALAAATATAAPAHAQLPLPDVILYGTATRGGEPATAGTVKVILPRGQALRAPIGEIRGTPYNYMLAVPLSMYPDGATQYDPASVRLGESLRFLIDDASAQYRVGDEFLTELVIPAEPATAVGQPFLVNLAVVQVGEYPLGDVNLSGRRDSFDARLVLCFDIGLILGDEGFPPAPGKIYLPLCDIAADGRCNSSDALRILRCDAGYADACPETGPTSPTSPTTPPIAPSVDGAVALRLAMEAGAEPDIVVVRVIADDPQSDLGAVALELHFDDALLAPLSCANDTAAVLGGVACNAGFAPGVVRLNAITTTGAGGEAVLGEIAFRVLDEKVAEDASTIAAAVAATLDLTVDGLFNLDGDVLTWRQAPSSVDGATVTEPAVTTPVDLAVVTRTASVYLPFIGRGW